MSILHSRPGDFIRADDDDHRWGGGGAAATTMTSRNETRTKMMQNFAERVGLKKLLNVIEGIQHGSTCCAHAQPKMSPTDDANQHANYYCLQCIMNGNFTVCASMRLPRVMQCEDEDAFTAA